jgi:hypothetical protein
VTDPVRTEAGGAWRLPPTRPDRRWDNQLVLHLPYHKHLDESILARLSDIVPEPDCGCCCEPVFDPLRCIVAALVAVWLDGHGLRS